MDPVRPCGDDELDAAVTNIFIQLSTGEVSSTAIHLDWTEEGLEVAGRAWDLRKAYRQLARTPAYAAFTVMLPWCNRSQATKLHERPVLASGEAS